MPQLREIEAAEDTECYAAGCQIDAGDPAFYEPAPPGYAEGAIYCTDHGNEINDGTYHVETED